MRRRILGLSAACSHHNPRCNIVDQLEDFQSRETKAWTCFSASLQDRMRPIMAPLCKRKKLVLEKDRWSKITPKLLDSRIPRCSSPKMASVLSEFRRRKLSHAGLCFLDILECMPCCLIIFPYINIVKSNTFYGILPW